MIREWLEYCHRPLRDVYSKSCIYWLVERNTARKKKKKNLWYEIELRTYCTYIYSM